MKILFSLLMIKFILFANDTLIYQTLAVTKQHEGFSRYLYVDNGNYSIGYGTNLSGGISKEEAELLLKYRLSKTYKKLIKYDRYSRLNTPRKIAVLDLTYNLGITKLLRFRHFIWRLKHGYYKAAANALRESAWYHQVGNRALYIVNIIEKG